MKKLLSSLVFFSLFSYSQGDKLSIADVINKNNLKKNQLNPATNYDENHYTTLVKQQSEKLLNPNEGMLPGMGYSTDTISRGTTICYKPLTVTRSNQASKFEFHQSNDISKILNEFNVTNSFRAGYGPFSANATFKYFKSLEEDNYSLSVNYFQKVSQSVNMTYSNNPDKLLTEDGKDAYRDGKNPMFRLLCGDRLIRSYEEGAALILSMKIILANRVQKETFSRSIGANYGSFFEASHKARGIAIQHNLSGRIRIEGFQLGGDPTQLSKVLSTNVINCDIKNIDECQKAVKHLLEYVSKDFPNQFKKESNIWVSPLVPTGGVTPDTFVEDLGLIVSPSFVTEEVREIRKSLVDTQEKNQAANMRYSNLLTVFPNGEYANNQSFTPEQRVKADTLNKNAISNLAVLDTDFGSGAAIDCLKLPHRCIRIKNEITPRLKNIEDNTIKPISCKWPENSEQSFGRICIIGNGTYALRWQRMEFIPQSETCNAFAEQLRRVSGYLKWLPCQGPISGSATKW